MKNFHCVIFYNAVDSFGISIVNTNIIKRNDLVFVCNKSSIKLNYCNDFDKTWFEEKLIICSSSFSFNSTVVC